MTEPFDRIAFKCPKDGKILKEIQTYWQVSTKTAQANFSLVQVSKNSQTNDVLWGKGKRTTFCDLFLV